MEVYTRSFKMIIKAYNNTKSKKKKLNKQQKLLLNDYNEWRTSNGMSSVSSLKTEKYKSKFVDYKPNKTTYRKQEVKSVIQDGFAACSKNSIMDRMNLDKEPEHVKQEILAKSKRIAQMYNKGGYQYITDDVDITTIGTRSRRM